MRPRLFRDTLKIFRESSEYCLTGITCFGGSHRVEVQNLGYSWNGTLPRHQKTHLVRAHSWGHFESRFSIETSIPVSEILPCVLLIRSDLCERFNHSPRWSCREILQQIDDTYG